MLKSFFAITDKGPYFNTNQDAYFINREHNVFGIIDAFGGTGIGDEIANRIILSVNNVLTKSTNDQDATLKYFYDSRRTVECNFILNELLKIHNTIMTENDKKSIFQKGAASCVILISSENRITLISIGKVYSLLIRNDQVQKIIIPDDSPCFENAKTQVVGERTWPKSGIGLFSPLQYQLKEINLIEGDQILLGSQGVLNNLEYHQLQSIFSAESSKQCVTDLLRMANEMGNRDNQAALLLRY